jgi:gliding motility-associated-like protein
MKHILITIAFLFFGLSLFSQHKFSENKGQFPESVHFKCKLNYGALFLESDRIVYNFADPSQYQHSHAHHGESDVEDSHHEINHKHELPTQLDFHAYELEFVAASPDVKIAGKSPAKDYENYFIGSDPKTWASRVTRYEKVYYENVFSGIDMCFYDQKGGLKYDIILHPGSNPDHVLFRYNGLDDIKIRGGNLILKTSISTTKEMKPVAYQMIEGDSIPVDCQFVLEDNLVSFLLPNSYHKDFPLIIDPSLVFSTYTGSTGDNWGFTATWDFQDNVYSGGIVFDVGYPVSIGAYQTNMAGGASPIPGNPSYYGNGCDVGIIKYNADGTQRLYATYLGGGTAEEMPHSMVVNDNNELIVFGTTGSSDFPTTANAYDNTFNGGDSLNYDNVISFPQGTDIFVSKFSEDGSSLLGSTYLGGSKNDGLNFKIEYTEFGYIQMHGNDSLYYNYGDGARGEVITDQKGFIYVGANTFSDDIAPGVFAGIQTVNNGGMDGLVAKFSANLSSLVWMSYLGGSMDDAIYSIYPDLNYDILVAGGTCSADFPTTAGSFSPNYNGGSTDAFIAKINQDGNSLLASTFFGSNAYDQAHFVRVDNDNKVHIFGQTEASGSTLIHNAGYSVPNSGQFLACFDETLSTRNWSTVFGRGAGHPVLSPSAFAVDVCDRIYLAGWGREWALTYLDAQNNYYTWTDDYGTKGLPTTPDALQTVTDGQDFYIMVLSEDASALEYATFFGEIHYADCGYSGHDHVDGGTSRFDNKGNVIQSVCASCGSCQEFPTMPDPGVWSVTNSSSNCNNAVFKINIIEDLAESSFDPIPEICAPFDVDFTNNSQGESFLWDFGDGTQSTEFEPTHTYTEEGVFEVMLVAYDPGACNYSDTSYREIEVQIPETMTLPPLQLCPGDQVSIGPTDNFDEDVTFQWLVTDGLNNSMIQNPIASPDQTTEYQLVVNDICTDTIIQLVEIVEIDLEVIMPQDTMICPGGQVDFTASIVGDVQDIIWSDNATFTNIISNSEEMTDFPESNATYWIQVTESQCNTSVVNSVNVSIHQFNLSMSEPPIICPGDSVSLSLTNLNPNDILTYNWLPSTEIIDGQNTSTVLVSPDDNATFTLEIENQMGCITTQEILVTIDDIQLAIPEIVHPLCYGDCTGAITALPDGYPPYNYTWSNGGSMDEITGLCAGNYELTVVDEIGCEAFATAEIIQPSQLTAQFVNVVDPQCDGVGMASAEIFANGGTPGYDYLWDDGTTSATNSSIMTGTHVVTVTDANDCETTIQIEVLPPGNLSTAVEEIEHNPCYGDCLGRINVSVDGGNEPFAYYWSNGENSQIIQNLCVGNYTVTIIDADNCVIHQSAYISQPTPVFSQIHVDHPIYCYGESTDINVTATGGNPPYSFEWNNGMTDAEIIDVTVGEYIVTVTDAHDCPDTVAVMLTQPEPLLFEPEVTNMRCDGVCNGSIVVFPEGGTEPYQFIWSEDANTSQLTNLCQGNYSLVLRDENGCETSGEFYVDNDSYIPPVDVATDDPEIYRGMSTNLFATVNSAYEYLWNPDNTLNANDIAQVVATPQETTVYEVFITDTLGCVNKDTIVIIVNDLVCGEPYLYIPNAFTPNDDGENDYFRPYAPVGIVKKMYFAVYNRWGEVMYESDNINDRGWDGTYLGKKLPPDVYVYWFEATCIDEEKFSQKGNVTLVR